MKSESALNKKKKREPTPGAMQLPKWAKNLFKPHRYKVLYGGRGSAKSHTVARALLLIGTQKETRILCAREFQNSIKDSSHKLLVDLIDANPKFKEHYSYTATGITGKNGTEFIFKGVQMNVDSIKSTEGVDILWLEEAQKISEVSWGILIPTIRKEGSEIWVTFNPTNEDDPTYTRFVDPKTNDPLPRKNAFIMKINWRQNPWFPQVLKEEKDYDFEVDPDKALHIWEGLCRSNSDAQIFKNKWKVEEFEVQEHWGDPLFGADFGFSNDPSTLIKMYLDVHERVLYISDEFWGQHIEIDELPDAYDQIPESRENVIRADNSRPETISYIARQRFAIEAAEKWPGSVEDGIEWIRGLRKVIIHTRCPKTAEEFKKYSFKVDKLTQKVTTIVVDDWNHCIDAIRYGLQPLIVAGHLGILDVLGGQNK